MIEANNRPNFATDGTIVSFVPHGTGVMILATDRCEIFQNEIRDNHSVGVMVFSYDVVAGLVAPFDDPEYDAYPSAIFLRNNVFAGNGSMPAPLLRALIGDGPTQDILWDGWSNSEQTGLTPSEVLCLRENGAASFRNLAFTPPFDFGEASFDASPHDCTFPALAPVELAL